MKSSDKTFVGFLMLIWGIFGLVSCQTMQATVLLPKTELPSLTVTFSPVTRNTPLPTPLLIEDSIKPRETPSPLPTLTAVDLNSFAVGFSADGSLLAFNSGGDGLIAEDQNGSRDGFLYHTTDGALERVSVFPADLPETGVVLGVAGISSDGRYLLSRGISGPPGSYHLLFLQDRVLGTLQKIDLLPLDMQTGGSTWLYLSPDGSQFAAETAADNLSGSRNDHWNVWLVDRNMETMLKISTAPDGKLAKGNSFYPTFSPDGQYLAFISSAINLIEGDSPCSATDADCAEIYLYDLNLRALQRIPAAITLRIGTPTFRLSLSNQAAQVAWAEMDTSSADYRAVVRVYDRETGLTQTICAGETLCTGHTPVLSSDGRWLAFATTPLETEPFAQVYLRDLQNGETTLISKDPQGLPGNGSSAYILLQSEGFNSDLQISGDGSYIAFSSQAQNLLPQGVWKQTCFDPYMIGEYPCYDLFLYDRVAELLTFVNQPMIGQ